VPEGPEIRRAADRLNQAVQGRPLEHVYLPFPALRRYGTRLKRATIQAFTPHGKALLTHFDNGLTLYSHNQLYGLWENTRIGAPYLKGRQLRLELGTAGQVVRLYSATDVKFWKTDSLKHHPFLVNSGRPTHSSIILSWSSSDLIFWIQTCQPLASPNAV